jgi:hypothetical protein
LAGFRYSTQHNGWVSASLNQAKDSVILGQTKLFKNAKCGISIVILFEFSDPRVSDPRLLREVGDLAFTNHLGLLYKLYSPKKL